MEGGANDIDEGCFASSILDVGLLPLYELYAARASPHRSQNPSGAIAHEPSDRAKHKRPGCPDP